MKPPEPYAPKVSFLQAAREVFKRDIILKCHLRTTWEWPFTSIKKKKKRNWKKRERNCIYISVSREHFIKVYNKALPWQRAFGLRALVRTLAFPFYRWRIFVEWVRMEFESSGLFEDAHGFCIAFAKALKRTPRGLLFVPPANVYTGRFSDGDTIFLVNECIKRIYARLNARGSSLTGPTMWNFAFENFMKMQREKEREKNWRDRRKLSRLSFLCTINARLRWQKKWANVERNCITGR